MAQNPLNKSRKASDPYLTIAGGGWEWRVLKAYQTDPAAPYARWFLDTRSPYTYGESELGDGYIADTVEMARMVGAVVTQRAPEVPDEALPRAFRR